MKRCLFLFLLSVTTALGLQAKDGDQVILQAGSANTFWTLTSAYFETDWSEASVEGVAWDQWLQGKGDDYVRDWPNDKRKIEEYFLKRFNKKTGKKGGLALQTTNPGAPYYFVIRPQDIDMGSIGGGIVASAFLGAFAKKQGGVNFKTGYADLVEAASGKVVCRLLFRNVKGDSGLNMSSQLIFVFEDLHDELIGFADRFKSQSQPEIYVEAGAPAALVSAPATPVSAPAAQYQPAQTATGNQPAAVAGVQQVSVKLKNGATISGELKSFDPLEKVVLVIAGQETTIPMEKVENVEMKQGSAPVQTVQPVQAPAAGNTVVRRPAAQPTTATRSGVEQLGNRKLLVTETENYPERITVTLGNTPVEMVLVKGGRMNMGYDGDHSLTMKSEPVHEVGVTSFYMSQPLSRQALSGFGKTKHDDTDNAVVEKYKDVQAIMSAIASSTGKPYRIPTEAEWEYAACSDLQNQLFAGVANKEKIAYDWCSDYYDEFKVGSVVVDPTGPMTGSDRVVRAYNNKYGKFNRKNQISVGRYTLGYIRLVIKAKDAGVK